MSFISHSQQCSHAQLLSISFHPTSYLSLSMALSRIISLTGSRNTLCLPTRQLKKWISWQILTGTVKYSLVITSCLIFICNRIAEDPSFPGLCHFHNGHGFKQWTGNRSKGLKEVCSHLLPSNDMTGISLACRLLEFTVSLCFSPTYAFPSFQCFSLLFCALTNRSLSPLTCHTTFLSISASYAHY